MFWNIIYYTFCAENPAKIWCGNWSKNHRSDSNQSGEMKIIEWKLCRPYVLQCYRHFKQLQRMQSLEQPIGETFEKPYKWKHRKKAPSCNIWKYIVEQSHTNVIGFASFWADSLGTPLKTSSVEKSNNYNHCDFASSQTCDFRIMMKTHSEERSYKCSLLWILLSKAFEYSFENRVEKSNEIASRQ